MPVPSGLVIQIDSCVTILATRWQIWRGEGGEKMAVGYPLNYLIWQQ